MIAMTFTRDNIVGVEFTEKKDGAVYKILPQLSSGLFPIEWEDSKGRRVQSTVYTTLRIYENLNNGTWIVKNSKV